MGLLAWWRAREAARHAARWVVVDVETSGLDAARDRLLAIAAVGVRVHWESRRLAVVLGDSFDLVVRQEVPSGRDNILVHGIGVQRQKDGVPASDALAAFARFAGDAPLLAFHAAFDRRLMGRYSRAALGAPLANRWADIEHLCAVSAPGVTARSLDEWMAHFGVRCAARHVAIADALAECELLLRVWPKLAPECADWRDVERLASHHRWLTRN